MKEQNGSEKKKSMVMTREKKFYLLTAIGCALTLVAIILVAVLVPNQNVDDPTGNKPATSADQVTSEGPEANDKDSGENNEPVVNTPDGMQMPLETVSIIHDYGFYHNVTLNKYYEHQGVDFTAEVGAQVLAVDDGVVESIYRDDVLTGTEITINHGDGVKTVYRFITVDEALTVGAQVARGDVIGTVAEATGEEYKDGAHLHFEIRKDGKQVDPATYLTFEEK